MEEEDIEEDDEDRIAIYPISPPTTIMSGGLIRIISGVKLVFQSYDFLRFAVLSGWCTEAIFTTAKCTVQINDVIAHCFYCCDARLAFNPSIPPRLVCGIRLLPEVLRYVRLSFSTPWSSMSSARYRYLFVCLSLFRPSLYSAALRCHGAHHEPAAIGTR